MTRLYSALLLIGTASRLTAQADTTSRCFTLVWRDSLWQNLLPDTVKLQARRDPNIRRNQSLFVLSPRSADPATSPRWRGILNAWWSPIGPDSLVFVLATPDASWDVRLRSVGDSLIGAARFETSAATGDPFPVRGAKVPCAP